MFARDDGASNEEQRRRIGWGNKTGLCLEPTEFMEVGHLPGGSLKNESVHI